MKIKEIQGFHLAFELPEPLGNSLMYFTKRESLIIRIVTDDGIGLTDSGRRSGLANMSARAADLGGECTIERVSDEGGTRLRWRVPIAG